MHISDDVRSTLENMASDNVDNILIKARKISANRVGKVNMTNPMLKPLEPLLNEWATIQIATMIAMEFRSLRRVEVNLLRDEASSDT